MTGQGKYDQACTDVRLATKARGVLLVVIDGEHGPGFSVQAPLDVIIKIPDMLRFMAEQIESDLRPPKE